MLAFTHLVKIFRSCLCCEAETYSSVDLTKSLWFGCLIPIFHRTPALSIQQFLVTHEKLVEPKHELSVKFGKGNKKVKFMIEDLNCRAMDQFYRGRGTEAVVQLW